MSLKHMVLVVLHTGLDWGKFVARGIGQMANLQHTQTGSLVNQMVAVVLMRLAQLSTVLVFGRTWAALRLRLIIIWLVLYAAIRYKFSECAWRWHFVTLLCNDKVICRTHIVYSCGLYKKKLADGTLFVFNFFFVFSLRT